MRAMFAMREGPLAFEGDYAHSQGMTWTAISQTLIFVGMMGGLLGGTAYYCYAIKGREGLAIFATLVILFSLLYGGRALLGG